MSGRPVKAALAIVVGAALFAVPGASSAGTVATCFGSPATIMAVPGQVTFGTSGPDVIIGTSGPDDIRAGRGADKICSKGGADIVQGGGGNDKINLGSGNDEGRGGKGADVIQGRRGHDDLYGGSGRDTLNGGLKSDRLWGGGNDDILKGKRGNDVLRGGKGTDKCFGGTGTDQLFSCNEPAPPPDPCPARGDVGQTRPLTYNDAAVSVTLLCIADPAPPLTAFDVPIAGRRIVAVGIAVTNDDIRSIAICPYQVLTLHDTLGAEFEGQYLLPQTTLGTNLTCFSFLPGETVLGWVPFEISAGRTLSYLDWKHNFHFPIEILATWDL